MKRKLEVIFKNFDSSVLNPSSYFRHAVITFIAWSLPFLVFFNVTLSFPESKYLNDALTEAIGPNLWNLMSSLAVFLFSLLIVFPKLGLISTATSELFLSVYIMGALTFGILCGQLHTLSDEANKLIWWKQGLFGITSLVLLICFFFVNLTLWYFHYLSNPEKSDFLVEINRVQLTYRMPIALCIMALIVYLNVIEL